MIQLEIYIKELTHFLRTVTLKNVYFADQMLKNWVKPQYRNAVSNTQYHPYYRHLTGDYILKDFSEIRSKLNISNSVADADLSNKYGIDLFVNINGMKLRNSEVYTEFDEPVFVNSFDTKEPIVFTKKLLSSKEHKKTASVYRIPDTHYFDICNRYQNSIDIIKAISYPINKSIDELLSARNYEILSCDLSVLHENERTSLYNAMLEVLNVVRRRWDVKEFTYEELYALSMQGKIWTILLASLFKQRIANIRTDNVHPYHIWRYLESHGIENCEDILSNRQALFLYKNFLYLLRNRGTDQNLILLCHKLLNEWNVTLHNKFLVQNITNEIIDAKSLSEINSIELESNIMSGLRNITKNEDSYINQTDIAKDELDCFKYLQSDGDALLSGEIESLKVTYEKERKSKLEYQPDEQFVVSTTDQTKQYEYTPHNTLQTKLLEFKDLHEPDIFAEIYSKFVTESLFYNIALGYADDILPLKLSGMQSEIKLDVKDVLALFIYCELNAQGNYTNETRIPHNVALTMPYLKVFPNIREEYNWANDLHPTNNQLKILPLTILLDSSTLPKEFKGEYHFDYSIFTENKIKNTLADISRSEYRWINDNGVMLKTKSGSALLYWSLTYGEIELTNDTVRPYWNWKYWSPEWKYNDDTETVFYDSILKVTEYKYLIDEIMPNYKTEYYIDHNTVDTVLEPNLVSLINEQAEGYVRIYRELHESGLSRQHSAVYQVLCDRTFNGIVDLNLSEFDTFEEFINSNKTISSLVKPILSKTEDERRMSFSNLADELVKILLPIDSKYLGDSTTLTAYRFKKLKELFISLTSYNIAYLEGDAFSKFDIVTIPCVMTSDFMEVGYITNSRYYDTSEYKSNIVEYGLVEKICFDELLTNKYVNSNESVHFSEISHQLGSYNDKLFKTKLAQLINTEYFYLSTDERMAAWEYIYSQYFVYINNVGRSRELVYKSVILRLDSIDLLYNESIYTNDNNVIVSETDMNVVTLVNELTPHHCSDHGYTIESKSEYHFETPAYYNEYNPDLYGIVTSRDAVSIDNPAGYIAKVLQTSKYDEFEGGAIRYGFHECFRFSDNEFKVENLEVFNR